MEKFRLLTRYKKMLADTVTPVSIYLKLRDRFANSLLLESSDYHGGENSFSYICCNPIAGFRLLGNSLDISYPDGQNISKELTNRRDALAELTAFSGAFEAVQNGFKFINNGLFGYMAYDAVQSFEDIGFETRKPGTGLVPEIFYQVFRHVMAIDHFKNELYLFEHQWENSGQESQMDAIAALINSKNFPSYHFRTESAEQSNFTDNEYLEVVEKGKQHCFRGDVFQIVLARRFQRKFTGDEFNVYRALRSINPSPYLFYFDYGNFKIFGSSPEAQIVIKDQKATIYPIAGTFRRTGNDAADAVLAQKLYDDPKENAEHIMLVDLARNDLSRNGAEVKVETFKEIQYYSHLIHLVSKVSGKLHGNTHPVQVVADTFPAGTLSGAPKFKAMELIDRYETVARNYYGGAIGFLGFNGDFNHAIMIRSFLSKDNTLHYQAGAGVVAKSDTVSELQEVSNKLAALRKALDMASAMEN